ncbi:AAA family ATPase [Actinoplanes sp. NPDC049598]|uniref:AAA family ATPase n=1 Tax=Actinoplanes sp. NPDC049598 TaxID=3154626 RepID=UPI003415BD49
MEGTETGWGRPAEPAPRWRALLDRARHGSRGADEQAETDREDQPQQPQQYGSPLPTRRPTNPLDSRGSSYGSRYDQHPAEPQPPGPASGSAEQQRPMPQRPINPLDPRWQARSQPAPSPSHASPTPLLPSSPQPPSQAQPPLQAQPPPQSPEPTSFFGPSSRSAPPPQAVPRDYPQVRASAAAPVMPPPVQPASFQPPVQPASFAPPAPAPAQPASFQPPAPAPAQPASFQPPAPAPAQPASFQPPAPAPAPRVAPSPTSPAAARIEWRQTRADDEMARAVSVMRRKLGKPRVLAFANPKGGVHKTTATVLAAATIGSVRGRGVLAWDDNELRGTLGLRAGSARHARTIKHLLADLLQIENLHGDALLQELDGYLRHASDGSYDVLAGEENPRFAARLDQGTVRRVMDLLRRTHDVICVDTGNNVESVNWQTVMRQADQLVITTVPREDAAFTADWMLDVLDESGMGDLVSNAVTLISCPSPGPLPLLNDFVKHFATRTRAVAVVPYDPALEVGSSIEYADLQQETRSAWLKAASVMIEPFAE